MAIDKIISASITDGTIATADIADGAVTSVKTTGVGGIKQADTWRMNDTYNVSGGVDTLINQYWERADDNGYGRIGTGMTESSGIFTFPETGIYMIHHTFRVDAGSTNNYVTVYLSTTTDNSSYDQVTESYSFQSSGSAYTSGNAHCLFDVTNTSNCKVKFTMRSAANITFAGQTDENQTYATFIRLGDT
tara:strand:- start:205 stop:774 length:570 start_codon:yes stop_codon:yes gene_type:complete